MQSDFEHIFSELNILSDTQNPIPFCWLGIDKASSLPFISCQLACLMFPMNMQCCTMWTLVTRVKVITHLLYQSNWSGSIYSCQYRGYKSVTPWCFSKSDQLQHIYTKMEEEKVELREMDKSPEDKVRKGAKPPNKFERTIQPCIAELIGTMFFVFIGCVSVIENVEAAGRLQPALVHGLAVAVMVACMAEIR